MSTDVPPNTQLTRTQQQAATVRDALLKQKKQIAMALPKHLDAEIFSRIVLTTCQKTPLLYQCSLPSLLGAVMLAAQAGLEPDGISGKAYLIPRKRKGNWECNFQIGYKGLLDLAYRSAQISFIAAEVVRIKDTYHVHLGTSRSLEHIPYEPEGESDTAGPVRAFYAVAKFKDGSETFVHMWKQEVDKIRDEFSDAADSEFSPWRTNELTYIEMGKKTALRRLCKTLPSSTQLQTAIAKEERHEAGLPADFDAFIDIPANGAIPESTSGSKLDQIVDGKPAANVITNETLQQKSLEKQLEGSMEQATIEDFIMLEKESNECGVLVKSVQDHVIATMGFETYGSLTRGRLAEVVKWIRAQRRK